jgi:hypothetical protein
MGIADCKWTPRKPDCGKSPVLTGVPTNVRATPLTARAPSASTPDTPGSEPASAETRGTIYRSRRTSARTGPSGGPRCTPRGDPPMSGADAGSRSRGSRYAARPAASGSAGKPPPHTTDRSRGTVCPESACPARSSDTRGDQRPPRSRDGFLSRKGAEVSAIGAGPVADRPPRLQTIKSERVSGNTLAHAIPPN